MPVPQKGIDYTFTIGLVDSANRPQFKVNPTLAAGDFKISKDGGALNNLANLPTVTPTGSRLVEIYLTSGEMDANRVVVQAVDAAGSEWDEAIVYMDTTINTVDSLASGTIYLASGSIFRQTFASGVMGTSGGFPILGVGSGSIQPDGSGRVNSRVVVNVDKSGYTLTASGLDTILVESGLNFRQAQSVIAAAAAGQLSGAGTTSFLIQGANVSGTTRITATVDASGNRSAITLSLPT